MAPLRTRQVVSKERFSQHFGTQKTQSYHDPAAPRGVPNHALRTMDWNPLGTFIAVASDRTIRVWNPERPNVKQSTELKGHTANIEKVAFNPIKEAELCSLSSDGVVRFWDHRTKTCVNEIKGLGHAFTLGWAPDGNSLVVGDKSDKIYVIDQRNTGPELTATHPQDIQTNEFAFCWSSNKIFLTTGTGHTKLLNYPDFTPLIKRPWESKPFSLNGHTSACLSVAMAPTGRYLATGGSDSIIALWDTTDWICQRTLAGMVGPVRSISFSFDGSYIVGGSDEGESLEIVHVETGEPVHTVKTATPCPIVAWHPRMYHLAFADLQGLKIAGIDPDRRY